MDNVIRKAYSDTGGNGGRSKAGRPRGSFGKHKRTIVRKHIIQNCRELAETRALTLTKEILEEEARLAFSDIREIFNEYGETLEPHQLPDGVAKAIQSVRRTEKTIPRKGMDSIVVVTYEYKFWDKSSALERLSKHLGLYKADNEQKPSSQINFQQINVDLKDFTERELELLVKLGGKLGENTLSLPEPAVVDIEKI